MRKPKIEYTEAMFRTWKRSEILKNDQIQESLSQIAKEYGYRIEDGFGMHVSRIVTRRGALYAELSWSGWEFQISTVSSHWNAEEAIIFIKQLQNATEAASELNTFLKSLDYSLKREFEAELEKMQEARKEEC